ncbi:hypothetical protein FHW36_109137 [Chitinophaga polysaccharea]|uniref:Uncharacterized protein n=1 Tax=Chitinophaga polysaccharea TaxID=1293035 RepID=A0A561PB42_9BACT|nr:hypothetical protein FHW36_109137 [Chitinophaga polysaccharea]
MAAGRYSTGYAGFGQPVGKEGQLYVATTSKKKSNYEHYHDNREIRYCKIVYPAGING